MATLAQDDGQNFALAAMALKKKRAANAEPKEELDPVDWMQANFWVPDIRQFLWLAPYQIAVIREAYKTDQDGRFLHDLIIIGDIKKSNKSTICAAVTAERSWRNDWFSAKFVANKLEQADSRSAEFFRRHFEHCPRYPDLLTGNEGSNYQKKYRTKVDYITSGYTTRFLRNGSVVKAIPVNPGGEAGGNDDLVIFTELWAARSKKMMEMWTETVTPPNKHGFAQRWVETYAGRSGEAPLLEMLYDRGIEGERVDLSYTDPDGTFHDLSDVPIFRAGRMLMLWNNQPRLPWQTKAYYQSQREELTADEFKRIHKNEWVSGTKKFVDKIVWEECQTDLPNFRQTDPVVLGVDAGVFDDSFGLVAGTHVDEMFYIRHVRNWVPDEDNQESLGGVDFWGTADARGPAREIVRLAFYNNIYKCYYDPYQLHSVATALRQGVPVNSKGDIIADKKDAHKIQRVNMVPFPQGAQRLAADQSLRGRIRDRTIGHSGEEDLTDHIDNANVDSKGRLVKRKQKLKIDLAVSAGMAQYIEEKELKEDEKPKTIARLVYNTPQIGSVKNG